MKSKISKRSLRRKPKPSEKKRSLRRKRSSEKKRSLLSPMTYEHKKLWNNAYKNRDYKTGKILFDAMNDESLIILFL